MDTSKTEQNRPNTNEITSAERIKALISISEDLPALLESAGSAIAMLTHSENSMSTLNKSGGKGLEARKSVFEKHVREYYTTLNKVQNSLMKEANALEEAGIIPKEARENDDGLVNGGLGNLDVAWLNSRSRDIGVEKEKELVKEAREWLAKSKNGNDDTMAE